MPSNASRGLLASACPLGGPYLSVPHGRGYLLLLLESEDPKTPFALRSRTVTSPRGPKPPTRTERPIGLRARSGRRRRSSPRGAGPDPHRQRTLESSDMLLLGPMEGRRERSSPNEKSPSTRPTLRPLPGTARLSCRRAAGSGRMGRFGPHGSVRRDRLETRGRSDASRRDHAKVGFRIRPEVEGRSRFGSGILAEAANAFLGRPHRLISDVTACTENGSANSVCADASPAGRIMAARVRAHGSLRPRHGGYSGPAVRARSARPAPPAAWACRTDSLEPRRHP